jgi:hypothetical protein
MSCFSFSFRNQRCEWRILADSDLDINYEFTKVDVPCGDKLYAFAEG